MDVHGLLGGNGFRGLVHYHILVILCLVIVALHFVLLVGW